MKTQHRHRLTLVRRPSAFALAGCLTLVAILACRDITAPSARPRPGRPGLLINPPGPVVVSPGNMRGWVFYDDQHDSLCTVVAVCGLVQGPTGVPAGAGSAELATSTTSDGKALVLADYAGVRFDQITSLSYATYRQTADAGNNLAISLQFNVDYDLADAATGYQGRLVYEPYLAAGGTVTAGTWQVWDAKAGKWWGTRSSVSKNGVTTANPCVQASPCTWAQVLATFPNIGVHATLGAVVLKAGSGWSSFRGDVDNLTISLNGVATTFDFEPTQTSAHFHLHTDIGLGVTTSHLPADSDYAAGSTVSFNFGVAAGYDSLVVLVDDSLATSTGQIAMDRDHTIAAGVDPHIQVDALTATIGTRIRSMLAASDKVTAYYSFFDWYMDQATITNPDSLAAHLALAQYLNIDPVRDSASLRSFDDALATSVYHYEANGDGTFYSWWDPPMASGASASQHASASASSRRLAGSGGKRTFPARARVRRQPVLRAGVAPRRSVTAAEPTSQPSEYTVFYYVNGINTAYDDGQGHGAFPTLRLLTRSLLDVDRFHDNSWIAFAVFYNRTSSVQVADNQRARLYCAQRELGASDYRSKPAVFVDWVHCTGASFVDHVVHNDYVEAITDWLTLKLRLPYVDEDAERLAAVILDESWRHTIFVAHSQGNMILAQALHRVEQIEGYPLAENAMCRAIIALASPINVGDFPLDTFHVKGFNIRGDLVPTIGLSNFPTMDTPLSALVADSVNASADPGLDRLRLGFLRLHGIDESYLGQPGPVAAVQSAAITLHKECVVGSFTVTPATSTVRMGDSVSFSSAVVNENGRALPNRSPGYQTQHPWGSMHDSTFTAVLPREDTVVAVVGQLYNSRVNGHAQVTIPLADITVHYTEVNETYWAVDSVRNWRLGVDLPPPSAPTWDGSAGDCSRSTTQQDGYSGTTFFSQRCSRVLDLPDEGRPEASFSIADERYAAAIASYKVHDFEYQTGQLLDIRRCGIAPYDDDGHYCWDRITVHAYDANGHAIARGKTCTVGCVDGGNYGPTGVKRGRLIAPSSTSKRPRSTRP